ncbi:Tetracycline resistance protein, class D, partial [Stegodyphus mimosarum]
MAVEDTVHVSDAFISIKQKRRLTYGTILMFNLCTGLGYAIIFPTIWNYIHDYLKGKSYMLGIVISAYSFSSFFANPLIGWWSDRSLNTRLILLVTILGELIGSILYFVGINTWILVLGRLIAGTGAGGGAAVLADITRTTSE